MFIPRHPVVENQFCQLTASGTTDGVGGVIAYAGSVCFLDYTATNQDAIVQIYGNAAPTYATERAPFGFLMQKVKTGYHQVHPVGFMMPGDLGSSDVIAQPSYSSAGVINGTKEAPVGVAHLGIWDTIHYTVEDEGTDYFHPGDPLYVASGAASAGGKVTHFGNLLSGVTNQVATVVKGASAAQVQANMT
ncbi:unnamed protein product, partial [marine sediment metagenome]